MIKQITKSKTMIFAFLLAVMSTVEAQVGIFEQIVGPEYYPLLGLVVSVIVAALRFVTTTPLDQK